MRKTNEGASPVRPVLFGAAAGLLATLVLRGDFILLIGIENGTVVFMLAQLTDVVRIDAGFLVDGGTALDDSVQITLRLVVETSVRQDTGDG